MGAIISKREQIIEALMLAVIKLEDVQTKVFRNLDKPQKIPEGGMIVVRDNDKAIVAEVFLNPRQYIYELPVTIETFYQHPCSEQRSLKLDQLLIKLGDIINDNAALKNLVEVLEIQPPEFMEESDEGMVTLRQASFVVVLSFSANNPLN